MTESFSALFLSADPQPLRGSLLAQKFFSLLLGFVLLLGAILPLTAQTITTGQLTGLITDPAGAAVANGTLTLKSDDTGETQTATTNSSGEFRFSLLRPGVYTLTVSSPGFEQVTQKATVNLGQSQAVNIQLGVQRQSTVVNVSEQAPLLQSDTANLATTFDSTQLQNLPAPGNDMTAYAFNAPGVTVSTGGGYGSFSAFGLPAVSNLFTINGIDNMDPYLNLNNSGASNLTLGSNEISEAAVVLNGYTGQYGRQAGANVNYVTKSGTNAFHGNAAWFWNGRYLNANDWFNNATGTSRPFAVSNEWADSIGGPILKDKLFFFVDNEGLRYVL
ncbi:MAG: TonB-dependent receptor, partial [Acidobacteriaceae bacterium]|nr:TonB-dependent receptor [Acidobacteriaceae bacterium]